MSKKSHVVAGMAFAGVLASGLVALSPIAADALPTGACKANHRGQLCLVVVHGKVRASWTNDKGGPNTITLQIIKGDGETTGNEVVTSIHKKAVPYGVLVPLNTKASSACATYYVAVKFANGGHSRTGRVTKAGC